MSVWNNKGGDSTTNWTNQDETTTTSWSTDGGGEVFGTTGQQSSTVGTFDSAAAAVTSIVGGRYHLFDDKIFSLGTDKDFSFRYSTTLNGFIIDSSTASNNFFTITKDGDELMVLDSDGDFRVTGSIRITNKQSLPSLPATGDLTFYNNDLYLAK